MSYLVGIDIGGTFTDCAIVDRAGKLLTTKVPSTPPDFARGMMDALGAGAEALGMPLARFCRDIAFLSHGTTVGTNTISRKRGAKVGLITTKGHEDAIHIMRGSRGYGGRDIRKVVHFPETSKPAPIVPKRLIRGVSERVDCFGEIVVALNEREAEAAIRELLALGVEAIAICFLWSFRNPTHENRVKEMVQRLAPEVFVTTSVDIAPKWGEYEYFRPKVDLQTIGAGGGSLARVQPEKRTMTVGPDSAGAFPGPVCYGRGGTVPTVTDAQLVLGYLDPDNFAGGRMRLDREAAFQAIAQLGKPIGMSAIECAAGICRI